MHHASRSITRRRESETGRPVQGRPHLSSQAVLCLMPANSAAFSALRVFASALKNGSRQPLKCRFRTGNSLRVVIQICTMLARAREAEEVGSWASGPRARSLSSQSVSRLMASGVGFLPLQGLDGRLEKRLAPAFGGSFPYRKITADSDTNLHIKIQIGTVPLAGAPSGGIQKRVSGPRGRGLASQGRIALDGRWRRFPGVSGLRRAPSETARASLSKAISARQTHRG